jgi:ABC-type multidrug transport system ATPase subunit
LSELLVKGTAFGYTNPVTKELSFALSKGQVLAICGANGSGKTTILKTLRGIIKEIRGFIEVDNRGVTQMERLMSPHFSFLPSENVGAWPDLTLKENFLFFLSYRGYTQKQAEDMWPKLAGQVHLEPLENRKYSTCSTGERKALHLISHLVDAERIILLDEPLAHMDDQKIAGFFNFLKDESLSCILTLQASHLDKWREHFNRILTLENAT